MEFYCVRLQTCCAGRKGAFEPERTGKKRIESPRPAATVANTTQYRGYGNGYFSGLFAFFRDSGQRSGKASSVISTGGRNRVLLERCALKISHMIEMPYPFRIFCESSFLRCRSNRKAAAPCLRTDRFRSPHKTNAFLNSARPIVCAGKLALDIYTILWLNAALLDERIGGSSRGRTQDSATEVRILVPQP